MMIEGPQGLEFFQGFPINALKRFHEQNDWIFRKSTENY